MKKISIAIFSFSFLVNSFVFAQSKEEVLMTVGNDKVTVDDFLNVYRKNNNKESSIIDKKALEDYLNLYTIFRLKVKEAKDLGIDTTKVFRDELSGYRRTLSQPYLIEKNAIDSLVVEAYDRMKLDIKTSHILAEIGGDKDTVEAYTRITLIRDFLKGKPNPAGAKKYEAMVLEKLKNLKVRTSYDSLIANNKINSINTMMKLKNRDFESVAKVVSDHGSKENGGDLGYMSSLSAFYPYEYESAAYKAKTGELTGPIHSTMGYHLMKVTDKRAHKEFHVAHLMLISKRGMTHDDSLKIKFRIDSLYGLVKNGANYEEITKKYSEHRESAVNGGDLGWMALSSNFPAEFKEGVLKLNADGEVSSPVQTRFGWHLIKKIATRELPPFDSLKVGLKTGVQNDPRSAVAKEIMIKKLKSQYKFKEVSPKNIADFYAVVDSDLVKDTWKAERAKALTKPMFTILNKTYTQQDFAKYIETNYRDAGRLSPRKIVDALYKPFVDDVLMQTKEDRLEIEYPEFKALMNEYRDGILLFNLTDQKVWSKAIKDTTGSKEYYEKNKEHFMWDDRLEASIYTCKDDKTAEKVRKMLQAKKTDREIVAALNKDTMIAVAIDGKTLFQKGDNSMLDASGWNPGLTANQTIRNKVVFANIKKVVKPTPKTYVEARGLITSEYQTWLEKEWIDSLKNKYPVSVDRKVLDAIQ